MLLKEKLDFFSTIVMKEADQKKQQILKEIEDEFNSTCEKARRDELKRADEILQTETYSAKQLKNREIISATTESKKALIDLRNQLTDELFSSVNTRLDAFMNSADYEKYLIEEIEKLAQKYTNFDIQLVPRDMKFADAITKKTGANVVPCNEQEYFIGGFKMILKDRKAIIDSSFLTRLEYEHKNFNLIKIS